MSSVLAIDAGTTGVTSLVLDERGRVLGRGYREIPQHFPRPGWVEHDPADLLRCACESARDAIAASATRPVALGIANQRETVLVWDRASGEPVHHALVWQDRRTAARALDLRATDAAQIARITGLLPDPYFSATKLEWLLREHRLLERFAPGQLAAGTVDTWLIWNLTGGAVHATDPTNASRTMLFDINERAWSAALGELFGVPDSMLPEVRRSSGEFGVAAREWLGLEIPIMGVAGDQQAALFGQGCWTRGSSKNTYGTGAFLLANAGAERPMTGDAHGTLTTLACDARGDVAYALEGAILVAGAAVQWLRDGLGVIESASDTQALAESLASNDGVYFVPALAGLGAPHWEPRARGTIVGLTRGAGRAHLARAALEAMAFSTADVLDAMMQAGAARPDCLRVDGGASQNDWLMQFQADLLGIPVERPAMVETTALGAAALAGLAASVWPSAKDFLDTRDFTRFEPPSSAAEARELRRGWERAVRATLAWARDGVSSDSDPLENREGVLPAGSSDSDPLENRGGESPRGFK
jgi:glycerol kinase